MPQYPYVTPIVGLRKLSHLEGNIKALDLKLSDEDSSQLEADSPVPDMFPHTMINTSNPAEFMLTKAAGEFH